MKQKIEFIILFAVIAVLISYLLLHQKDRTHYQLPAVPEISKNQIDRIEIHTAKDDIVLKRKDKTWYIGAAEYPADAEKIDAMLNVCQKLTVTALVSESKNYLRYDLNDDKKITVKAWHGSDIIRQFDIGKPAATYRHTFVKLAQNASVYHARGDFRRKFDVTVDELRDKTILSFVPEHIRSIHISEDKNDYVLQRKAPAAKENEKENVSQASNGKPTEVRWETGGGRQLDGSSVKRLLSTLSRLECDSYIDGSKKADFANPFFVVELSGQAESHALSIFSKTDKNADAYPAVSTENQYPFLLTKSQVDDIKKMTEESLKKTNGKQPSP
jgi:hypothetical protein